MTTWPTAAIIGAIVSLIVVAVNVISARIARQEERKEKRHEWLRDKQVRDIEEMIPALSHFMEEIADCVEDIDATQSIMNDHLRWELDGRAKHADDLSWIATGKIETAKMLRESGDSLHQRSVKLNELAFTRGPWFAYTTRRLTIWLESKDETRHSLDVIGEEMQDFCLKILRMAGASGSFYIALSRNKGELSEEDVTKSEFFYEQLRSTLAARVHLEAAVIAFQEALANRFKAESLPTPIPSNDGLLVWLAQRIENGVRKFFH